jgi:hypothetical protein
MISKSWRDRLFYLAMSLFVSWHATAIVLAPAPDSSPPVASLRALFGPYFALFRLENTWGFFENINRSAQFRYVIKDADGKEHIFVPVDEFNWYHPRYNWFERTYWAIMEHPELHGDYFTAFFCRQHAALKPVAVTLLLVLEQEFRPEDQLRGHKPLDPEFITVDTLVHNACPQ